LLGAALADPPPPCPGAGASMSMIEARYKPRLTGAACLFYINKRVQLAPPICNGIPSSFESATLASTCPRRRWPACWPTAPLPGAPPPGAPRAGAPRPPPLQFECDEIGKSKCIPTMIRPVRTRGREMAVMRHLRRCHTRARNTGTRQCQAEKKGSLSYLWGRAERWARARPAPNPSQQKGRECRGFEMNTPG
jgi:hypothetical protein